ncbi:xylosidase/arabinosidase [Sarocladium strictum]
MRLFDLPLVALSLLGVVTNIVKADNPIVQTDFTADPAPIVYNNRLYVFTSHDEDDTSSGFFNMKNWRLFSTVDMANWLDHGSPMGLTTFSWASKDAWAGQVIERNNKFYYYVPITRSGGCMAIGVGVSDKIEGPYRDAIGKPLVENCQIDPTVYIDDGGQAYLYWGNPDLTYVKLNADMISYSGGIQKVTPSNGGYQEGPWFYKRGSLYYMIYAGTCCSENIRYATSNSPTGPWTYRGVIMDAQGKSFTNHAGMIDYNGASYFFYHNGALPNGGGYTRSVAVEKFTYNSDGTIPKMSMTSGPPQTGTVNPYVRQEAELIAWSSGLKTEVCGEGGLNVGFINNNDYIKVRGVAFGTGAKSLSVRVASANSGGNIEVRLGSQTGTLVGTCKVPGTGGWQTYTTVTCTISGATGTQDLFWKFTGSGSGELFNFNWWQFDSTSGGGGESSQPPVSSTSSTTLRTTTSQPPTSTVTGGPACGKLYEQCGGDSWTGATCCAQGKCTFSNQWYSQCL